MTSRRLRQRRSPASTGGISSSRSARGLRALEPNNAASVSSSSSPLSSPPQSEDDFDPNEDAASESAASSVSDRSGDSRVSAELEPSLDVLSAGEETESDDGTTKRRGSRPARKRAKRSKAETKIASVKVESELTAFSAEETEALREKLLTWYVGNCRKLPWRAPPRYRVGASAMHPAAPEKQSSPGAPYAVWVSEVMSQQTRLSVVVEYWKRWMAAFPTVEALAEAPLEQVNELWSGLGYYRRAKFLHEGASQIVAEYGGHLPESVAELLKVKGIGKYTAGAVSSISFNKAVPAVDGNVERVLARMRPGILPNAAPTSTPGAKAKVYDELASGLVVDIECAGDFNQALMELGATVCTVHNPVCDSCPVQSVCGSFAEATASGLDLAAYAKQFPVKDKSRKTKQRDETVLVCVVSRLVGGEGTASEVLEYLLLQRPASGLLAGMWESPNLVLSSADASKYRSASARARLMDDYLATLLPEVGVSCGGPATESAHNRRSVGETAHVFSHIKQRLLVERLQVEGSERCASGTAKGVAFRWLPETEIGDSAVATQMRKALALAFDEARPKAGSKRIHARKLR